jgi:hypothetical protein
LITYIRILSLKHCFESQLVSQKANGRRRITLFQPFRTLSVPQTCKQPKPKTTKATQNKPTQNAIADLLLLKTKK